MRSRPRCVALGVVGIALAVYGVASLTGGWLGTPPWWKHRRIERIVIETSQIIHLPAEVSFSSPGDGPIIERGPSRDRTHVEGVLYYPERRRGREIAGGVIAVGLALVAFAAWPRQSKARPPTVA